MKDVISVIVPVYNVAAYLPECLDSILSQDYDKLEVILIDDGSTDDSGAICDAYARRDGRIRVIHQKNGGAAAAKNAGLRAATGEYLSFADSDDFLEPGAYAYMLALLKENDADIVRCAFQNRFRTRTEQWLAGEDRCVMEGKAFLVRFTTDWTCGLLWNKLYKRALFDGIFFEEGHKIDDEYFTYQGVILTPVVGWTTHHAIVEYKGKWYLFHHDCVPSNGKTWLRSLKVCELEYDANGRIITIEGQ